MTKKDKRFIAKMRLKVLDIWMNTYDKDGKKFHDSVKVLKITYPDIVQLFHTKRWPK